MVLFFLLMSYGGNVMYLFIVRFYDVFVFVECGLFVGRFFFVV